MVVDVRSYLRRWALIRRARRALSRGAPELALEHLRDPLLGRDPQAAQLRARTVDELCLSAGRRAQEGRDSSVARLLGLVESEDPERAAHWRTRIDKATQAARALARGDTAAERQRQSSSGHRWETLPELLERMRRDARERPDPEAPSTRVTPLPEDVRERIGTAPFDAVLLRLGVDDGGELLVVAGAALTFGHSRAGEADLPFLADVAPLCARVQFLGESFHGGFVWSLEPTPGERLLVNGEVVASGPVALCDGDAVSLAPNLTFTFRVPDPSSSAAILELYSGVECLGAQRILLIGPGPAGRVRIGRSFGCAVRVARLAREVTLEREGPELVVRSKDGLATLGADRPERAPELRVPCPPARRVDLVVGQASADGPPFGLFLAPVKER